MHKKTLSKNFLRNQILSALQTYFAELDHALPADLYQLVLTEVEAPLLEFVMKKTNGNQSLAAKWLGLNRGTLRKLLARHNLA
jgi:Fis family transcriptional regulator